MSYSIRFMFKVRKEVFTKDRIESFITLLCNRIPETFIGYDKRKIEGIIDRFYNEGKGNGLSLDIRGPKGRLHEYILDVYTVKRFKNFPFDLNDYYLCLCTDLMFFEGHDVDLHISYLLNYAKLISLCFNPDYGKGDHELALEHNNYDFKRIYWLNFFSPETVEKIGRKKILSAPAYSIDELENGSMLLIATERQELMSDELVDKISKHLGLNDKKNI
jgi:hypothetical protein